MRGRLAAVAVASMVAAGTAPARADILSLSAMGFVRYDPSGTSQDPNPEAGTLAPVIGTDLFAAAPFPVNGARICKLTLVYGDDNPTEGISATLYRKRIANGGTLDALPLTIAKVSSTGTVTGMRSKSSTSVLSPVIDLAGYFYYVQVTAENFNTILVGVQIEYKATCP